MNEDYKKLMAEMPKIAEVVKSFPESMQQQVFDRLVNELKGVQESAPSLKSPTTDNSSRPAKAASAGHTNRHPDLTGICTVRSGEFHFTVRDLKAKNAKDAGKRLVYVLIYAYMRAMEVDSVSRKSVITPQLNSWRLNDGNIRGLISKDPGILKNGDLYSLDVHGEKEAEGFIQEIKDPNVAGSWSPSSKKRKKKDNGV